MNRQRLKPLQQLAEEREQLHARELAERQRTLAAQEQRLTEITRYAQEYARLAPGLVDPALLANRRAFIEKLDTALVQQRQHVESAREGCESGRARLVRASRDVAVLDRLAAGYMARELRTAELRAQRELDDHAIRRHRSSCSDGDE